MSPILRCSNLNGEASTNAAACEVLPVPGVPVITMLGSLRDVEDEDEDVEASAELDMAADQMLDEAQEGGALSSSKQSREDEGVYTSYTT